MSTQTQLAVNPRTPAEALRWAAWRSLTAAIAEDRLGSNWPPHVRAELASDRLNVLDRMASQLLDEADRLDAIPVAELSDDEVGADVDDNGELTGWHSVVLRGTQEAVRRAAFHCAHRVAIVRVSK